VGHENHHRQNIGQSNSKSFSDIAFSHQAVPLTATFAQCQETDRFSGRLVPHKATLFQVPSAGYEALFSG